MSARRRTEPRPIRFGTSGWRGTLADEVTDERLRAFVAGAATWLARRRAGTRVLVAFDGRFASQRMAVIVAQSLRDRGFDALVGSGITPTPALARAIPRRRAAGGLMVTASHNPAQDHGVKLFGPRGAAIGARAVASVEKAVAAALLRPPRASPRPGRVGRADLAAAYARDLARATTLGASPRLRVVYDAMHGAGGGVLDTALRSSGGRVELLRGDRDPLFGGDAPDPTPERLRTLARRVRGLRGLRLGLATDGDADRIAAVDERGRVLGNGEIGALVLDHLARTGRVRGGVALTLATGTLIERVGLAHQLRITRHAIGFKHLAVELLAGRSEVAVDESGGIAFGPFSLDKDGMFAGALLAESVALRRMGLGAQLAELREQHGPAVAGRRSLVATPRLIDGLERLCAAPPERVGGCLVRGRDVRDGLRLELDDGFVMWRASGTEPLVRIYGEANSQRRLRTRLTAAERLLRRALG